MKMKIRKELHLEMQKKKVKGTPFLWSLLQVEITLHVSAVAARVLALSPQLNHKLLDHRTCPSFCFSSEIY